MGRPSMASLQAAGVAKIASFTGNGYRLQGRRTPTPRAPYPPPSPLWPGSGPRSGVYLTRMIPRQRKNHIHFVTRTGPRPRDTLLAHAKLHAESLNLTRHLPGAATGEPLRAISVYFRANLFAKSRRRAATDESASSVSAPHLMNMATRPLPTCVVIRRDPLRDDRRIPPRQRSEPCPRQRSEPCPRQRSVPCPHLYLM
jgi:hypothetical protein